MIAESKASALSRTISYISLEIILAGRPFFGFTIKRHMKKKTVISNAEETDRIHRDPLQPEKSFSWFPCAG
jgi:hypothetical protein